MLRVGLTGGLASGKTFAAREFERLGCRVLSADRVGHRILRDDKTAGEEIVRAFGTAVLDTGGGIDRRALGAAVFGGGSSLERLNAIVHPRVFERLEAFFREVEARDPRSVAMVEAAIMIESGSYRRYDRLVVAACSRELQIERFLQRGGSSREDAEARLARQMPLEDKVRFANYVIDTSGSKEETLRQVRETWRNLLLEAERTAEPAP